MTEEEKKMLDIFKQEVEKEQSEYEQVNEYTKFFYNNHKFILNLIQKQEEELYKKEWLYERALSDVVEANKEIEKKDKIIDKMAHLIYEVATSTPGTTFYYLRKMGFDDSKCDKKKCKLKNCGECIKQYFEKEIENE